MHVGMHLTAQVLDNACTVQNVSGSVDGSPAAAPCLLLHCARRGECGDASWNVAG